MTTTGCPTTRPEIHRTLPDKPEPLPPHGSGDSGSERPYAATSVNGTETAPVMPNPVLHGNPVSADWVLPIFSGGTKATKTPVLLSA